MADVCKRTDWWNRKIQAICRLCKLFGNFHSSIVLLCLCVQEESHCRRMPQPPLAELTPPSQLPPAPPHQVGLLPGRAGDEPIGVRAREPGYLPRAGLDRFIPHVPGPGWAEDRPWHLLLQRAPLSHAAWDKAGTDLLNDVSPGGERLSKFKLHRADTESQWACSFLVWLRAMLYGCCMPAAGCFYCCDVCELSCV